MRAPLTTDIPVLWLNHPYSCCVQDDWEILYLERRATRVKQKKMVLVYCMELRTEGIHCKHAHAAIERTTCFPSSWEWAFDSGYWTVLTHVWYLMPSSNMTSTVAALWYAETRWTADAVTSRLILKHKAYCKFVFLKDDFKYIFAIFKLLKLCVFHVSMYWVHILLYHFR